MSQIKNIVLATTILLTLLRPLQAEPHRQSSATARLHSSLLLELATEARKDVSAAIAFAARKRIAVSGNRILVSLWATEERTEEINRDALLKLGVETRRITPKGISAYVPIDALSEVSKLPGIRSVRLPERPLMDEETTEGLGLINANTYHSQGIKGSGVKIAVIDASFGGLIDAITADEFSGSPGQIDNTCTYNYVDNEPGIAAVNSFDGNPHGTQVAQILHDIAPEATLCLKLVGDVMDYQDAATDALTESVSIVSESLSWSNLSYYDGTGIVSDLVSGAANDILWVTSAGNDARRHWRGYYTDLTDVDGDGIVEFSADPLDESNTSLSESGETKEINIHATWDDWPTTAIDYNIYLLKGSDCMNDFTGSAALAGAAIAEGNLTQEGPEPPIEKIEHTIGVGQADTYCIAIHKSSTGPDAEITLFSSGDFAAEHTEAEQSLRDPAADEKSLAVAAIPHTQWGTGPQSPSSSRGPRNLSRHSSLQLTKPDISGPTNVTTSLGFPPSSSIFGGTSAATPHVAACAALILSEALGLGQTLTVSELRNRLENNTSGTPPGGLPGKNSIFGSGRLSCSPDTTCLDDALEEDDTCDSARLLSPVGIDIITESHRQCDEDWLRLVAAEGERYDILTSNLSPASDTYLELYDEDCVNLLETDDDGGFEPRASYLDFSPPSSGVYPVRIKQNNESYGGIKSYDVSLICVTGCRDTADLIATISDLTDPISAGDNITWIINIINNGPEPASEAVLTSTLPASATYATTSHPSICAEQTGIVTCNLGTLLAGEPFAPISITATVCRPGYMPRNCPCLTCGFGGETG